LHKTAQTDQQPRHCIDCGHILKDEEKKCPICWPEVRTPKVIEEPKTEDEVMHEEGFKQRIRDEMVRPKPESEPEPKKLKRKRGRPLGYKPSEKKADGRRNNRVVKKQDERKENTPPLKKGDGRKENKPPGRYPSKTPSKKSVKEKVRTSTPSPESEPEPTIEKEEKFCPLTKELCKENECGWWNSRLHACAILILSQKNIKIERLTQS
jgi:hypothetical protein